MNLERYIRKLLPRFFKDETGQSTTEYILILFVVILIAVKFKQVFATKLSGVVDQLAGKMGDVINE